MLTVYLLLLGAFTALIYVAVAESALAVGGQVNMGEIGRTLFTGIIGIEMMLVAFIAPAFTAGAISGEREHQTYELLRTTLLAPSKLVLGKLLAALFYVLLLLLAAVPLRHRVSSAGWRDRSHPRVRDPVRHGAVVLSDGTVFLVAGAAHDVGQCGDVRGGGVHHLWPADDIG